MRHHDLDRRLGVDSVAVERHGIFRWQAVGTGEPGYQAKSCKAGPVGYQFHAVGKERGIAAEFVDEKTLDARSLCRCQQLQGTDDAGDDAAAVDVAHQHHGNVGRLGKAHIGDVAGAEIDFGG